MRLKIFNGSEDDSGSADVDRHSNREPVKDGRFDSAAMPRFLRHHCHVFPPYGVEYADLTPWKQRWESLLPGRFEFWQGFTQGGVLSIPHFAKGARGAANAYNCAPPGLGCTFICSGLTDEAGEELREYVHVIAPRQYSAIELAMGFPRNPRVSVKVTPEHAESAGDERYVLVVAKESRRSIKFLDRLPEWYAPFGVRVCTEPGPPPPHLLEEMQNWFGNPNRNLIAVRIEGGVNTAAWQTAVLSYIGSFWNLNERGLDTLHFITRIEGQPNYRKNWTSNK